MDKRQHFVTFISERLAYLVSKVEVSNALNLTDADIHAENFYRDLLNIVFDKRFVNTNFIEQNAAYIDLIDADDKLAIQVTAQNDNTKIKKTIEGFYSKEKYQGYKLKILLIAKKAKHYRTDFTNKGTYDFNAENDIWDVNKIGAFILDKNVDQIEKVAEFLGKEVLLAPKRTESFEIETIMALIDFLSKDENRILSDKNENVDPELKVYNRFSEHSAFIINQYQDLYMVYYSALKKAEEKIDTVNAIIITSYLKDESDVYLTMSHNDPKEALNSLVEFFYSKLSESGFAAFNKQAIRFFLLDEMIKCNVFPN